MENSDQGSQNTCFLKWMKLQEQDLSELLQALNLNNSDGNDHASSELEELIKKNIAHFQEYMNQRKTLASKDISPYFSPTWCTSLEGSMLWAGGCRPSIFIRLVYTLSGKEIASNIDEFLQGNRDIITGAWKLSSDQLKAINDLQVRTIEEEDDLSQKLAGLQEEMADQPIAVLARDADLLGGPSQLASDDAVKLHDEAMVSLLDKADNLRFSTMKEVIGLLNPVQAVEFLTAARKLHLCIHSLGVIRDQEHGRFK